MSAIPPLTGFFLLYSGANSRHGPCTRCGPVRAIENSSLPLRQSGVFHDLEGWIEKVLDLRYNWSVIEIFFQSVELHIRDRSNHDRLTNRE